jgi:hypothetical protein
MPIPANRDTPSPVIYFCTGYGCKMARNCQRCKNVYREINGAVMERLWSGACYVAMGDFNTVLEGT